MSTYACVCSKVGVAASIMVIAITGIFIPAIVSAMVILGGVAIVGGAATMEYICKRSNIQGVEGRWEQFVKAFQENFVYYCDSIDTVKKILTHVKHVVYQEETTFEFFRSLFGSRNPVVTEHGLSDELLCGYLEDATHVINDSRAVEEFHTRFKITRVLFKIIDLIKLSLILNWKSESATSKPLRSLTDFLDIAIDVMKNLPEHCDCSRFDAPHTYESMIKMYESAIDVAVKCESEAWKVEKYLQKIYVVQLLELFRIQAMERMSEVEIWKLQDMYEEYLRNIYHDERCEITGANMLASLIAAERTISDEMPKNMLKPMSEPELKNMKEPMTVFEEKKIPDSIAKPMPKPKPKPMPKPKPCSACKAYRCQCIEVCRICIRPIKKALQPCL